MAKVIAVVSQKGGVGKTTSAANLGASLAREGQLVLLVEVDPQGALAPSLGISEDEISHSLLDTLRGEVSPERAILDTSVDNLSLLSSRAQLNGELELEELCAAHPLLLRDLIEKIAPQYDVLIIDGPPTLGSLTRATLMASDSYLVPVQAEEFSYRTLPRLLNLCDRVRDESNPELTCEGLLITMVDLRTRMSVRVVNQLQENYGDRVLMAMVPRTVSLQEMPVRGTPAVLYAATSRGAQAYGEVALELLVNLEHGAVAEALAETGDLEDLADTLLADANFDQGGQPAHEQRPDLARPADTLSPVGFDGLNTDLLLTSLPSDYMTRFDDDDMTVN